MQVLTVDYLSSNAPELLVKSFRETGFAVLKNHPIDNELVRSIYKDWTNFFASNEKQKYLFDKVKQDGYFPIEVAETAKGHSIKDIKEFYQYYPWGRYPQNINDDTKQLYNEMSQLAAKLLQWIDEQTPAEIRAKFSLPLSDMIADSSRTMLRILHYPPLQGNEEPKAIRAAAHEDINLITLLAAATEPGLEVMDTNNQWHKVMCDPDTIVINAGDMLQMSSENYYRSTTHRVVNPKGDAAKKARLSMPLFLHPRDEVVLSSKYTAKEYLQERLRELGLV